MLLANSTCFAVIAAMVDERVHQSALLDTVLAQLAWVN